MLIARSNLAQVIDTLKDENVWVVGLDQDGETVGDKTQRHLTGAVAMVVGSEGEGIRQLTRAKCDIILKLPMRGQSRILECRGRRFGGVISWLILQDKDDDETRRLETRRLFCLKQPIIFHAAFYGGRPPPSHQVEGNNTNNQWWKWEQEGHTNGRSGLACDWWGGRWKEDFDRAAEGGQNAHRLSVEWSRIQPTPDTWDEDALERYRNMLRGLRERGITPMVTLHHFTDPLWLYEQCGWENEAVVPLFEKYVRKTVEALKEYCTLWCTINEPNVYALSGYVTGAFPACNKGADVAMKVLANMLRGHAAAYRAIHAIQPEVAVGYASAFSPNGRGSFMVPTGCAHAQDPV